MAGKSLRVKVIMPYISNRKSSDGTLLVGDRELLLGQTSFTRTDNNSEQMAVDGRAAGAETIIWNGTGASDAGGDWARTGIGTETAGSMYSGTNGLDTGLTTEGSQVVFNNGALLDVASTYAELSFWVNIQTFPGGSRFFISWLNASDVQVGMSLRISNYVTNMDTGIWRKVTIPIADFALTTNVQKLRFQFSNKSNQQFYFDDVKLVSAGGAGPFIYQVAAPSTSVRYHVSMLVLMVAASEAGWDDNKFANITALQNGLLLRQRDLDLTEDNILWLFNSRDNVDLFGRYHPQESFTFSNGKLLVGFMVKPGKASITITDRKVLEFVVRDDLSALGNVRAYAHYGVEEA